MKTCYVCREPVNGKKTIMIEGFTICKAHEGDDRTCTACGEKDALGDMLLIDDEWYCGRCYDVMPSAEEEDMLNRLDYYRSLQ